MPIGPSGPGAFRLNVAPDHGERGRGRGRGLGRGRGRVPPPVPPPRMDVGPGHDVLLHASSDEEPGRDAEDREAWQDLLHDIPEDPGYENDWPPGVVQVPELPHLGVRAREEGKIEVVTQHGVVWGFHYHDHLGVPNSVNVA